MLSIGLTLDMISDIMINQFLMILDQDTVTSLVVLKSGSRVRSSRTLLMDLRLLCADSLRLAPSNQEMKMILVCKRKMISTLQLDSCQLTMLMPTQ